MIRTAFLLIFLCIASTSFSQNDLLNLLTNDSLPQHSLVTGTFKSTRIMNGHSVMKMAPGQLDFRISHRFGLLNSGAYEFFGLDQSNIHLSLEYGINNWLTVGLGRGNYEKTFDGFAKFSILRQSTGPHAMPVSVSILSSVAANSMKWTDPGRKNYFSSRLSYVEQLLIGRKFNRSLSFQLSPSFVHRNLVSTVLDPNDLYSIGAGGRVLLTKRISFNAEYYYMINPVQNFSSKIYNPLSLGFDIETGGHVFQLVFTNSIAMIEKAFIGETTGSWTKGDIHFGFNISRVFNLKRHETSK